jgi:hypothetical protein
MSELYTIFKNSNLFSTKHLKYFDCYEELLQKYKNKKITLVEIGVLSGGSLLMWRNYLGNEARIIGIDLNESAKKLKKYGFEIFIGNQSDPEFWKKFYKKVGKIDILIDDGGHTNNQQIVTLTSSLANINNDGIIIVEDTHSSYMKNFDNPSKYSFINFMKKTIDDLNSKFPGLKKFKYSLNDYIYALVFYESLVGIKIDRKRCYENKKIKNNGSKKILKDIRVVNRKNNFLKNFFFKYFIYKKKIKNFFL